MWAGWWRPAGGHVLEEDPHQAAGGGGRPPPTALHQQAATRLLRQPENPALRYQYTDRTHQEIYRYWVTNFFSLIVFGGKKSILFIFSSAAPQRTAYREVPSQMADHLRTGSPLEAGEIVGFEPRTAVSQSVVSTNEPPLLPKMSHHCSHLSH
jgi:hypothetical protein